MTVTGLLVAIGQLSGAFRSLRWDDAAFDMEGQATAFADALSCVEILAAFFGFTITQCLIANQDVQNQQYPQGWKPAGDTQPAK